MESQGTAQAEAMRLLKDGVLPALVTLLSAWPGPESSALAATMGVGRKQGTPAAHLQGHRLSPRVTSGLSTLMPYRPTSCPEHDVHTDGSLSSYSVAS